MPNQNFRSSYIHCRSWVDLYKNYQEMIEKMVDNFWSHKDPSCGRLQLIQDCIIVYNCYCCALPLLFRFPNSVCSGTSYNGTCYSSTECSQLGGTSSGTCAAGYGVCCICKTWSVNDFWLVDFNWSILIGRFWLLDFDWWILIGRFLLINFNWSILIDQF